MTETVENAMEEEKQQQQKETSGEEAPAQGADGSPSSEEKRQEEDFKAKYYYLAAEMDNMRKRFERERENWIKFGNEKILSSLVEVMDNLDLTAGALVKETDPKIKNLLVGVEMVRKQFMDVLAQNGLTPVESLGKAFDPNFHEAMGQQKAQDQQEDNQVVQEYKKGYVLNGRLLRPAKVIVAKKD